METTHHDEQTAQFPANPYVENRHDMPPISYTADDMTTGAHGAIFWGATALSDLADAIEVAFGAVSVSHMTLEQFIGFLRLSAVDCRVGAHGLTQSEFVQLAQGAQDEDTLDPSLASLLAVTQPVKSAGCGVVRLSEVPNDADTVAVRLTTSGRTVLGLFRDAWHEFQDDPETTYSAGQDSDEHQTQTSQPSDERLFATFATMLDTWPSGSVGKATIADLRTFMRFCSMRPEKRETYKRLTDLKRLLGMVKGADRLVKPHQSATGDLLGFSLSDHGQAMRDAMLLFWQEHQASANPDAFPISTHSAEAA